MEEVKEPLVTEQKQSTFNSYKTLSFYDANKKIINIVAGALIVLVGGYFVYQTIYIKPLEKEAKGAAFRAEQYFERDSFNLALNGDKANPGFLDIISQYGGTKTANLAHYYAGVSFLHLGQYQEAIDHLSDFSSDDVILNAISKGAIGDAYSELNQTDDALKYYLKASKIKNEFTSPIYLMKAAQLLEEKGDYSKAIELYTEVKNNYSESEDGKNIEKYIAKAETLANKK